MSSFARKHPGKVRNDILKGDDETTPEEEMMSRACGGTKLKPQKENINTDK